MPRSAAVDPVVTVVVAAAPVAVAAVNANAVTAVARQLGALAAWRAPACTAWPGSLLQGVGSPACSDCVA